jgi:cobalt-zinc-cadmium resistance protein CzcA
LNAGEIDVLEYNSLFQLALYFKEQEQTYTTEIEKAKANIKHIAFLPDSISLKDTNFVEPQGISEDGLAVSNRFLQMYELSKQQKSIEGQLIKTNNIPTFNVGYFNQSLLGVEGFQGIIAGVKIPLFGQNNRKKLKQNNLEVNQIEQQQILAQNKIETELKNVIQEANQYNKLLEVYGKDFIEQMDKNEQHALKRIEVGEINSFQFAQIMKEIMDSKISYLKLLNSYQQAVNKIEYLTK